MYLELAGFIVGLILLVFGAQKAVTSAAELALYFGLSTFFIGVTVISIGTSIPEMTTSIYGALYGGGDLVVGNIIGSEVSQITLAIGIVALISPIVADRRNVLIYGGAMILSMIIMILTIEDGILIRSEGLLMMLAYVFFIHDLYSHEGGEEIGEEIEEEKPSPKGDIVLVLGGLSLVIVGGHLMVTNGLSLARTIGIPEYIIGFLVGLGTTAPEITVAGIAAKKGRGGISIGSLLGSNITDPVFSFGLGGLVSDIVIGNPESIMASAGYMLLVSILVLSILYIRRGIDRKTAILCILLYLPLFFIT